MDRGLIRHGGFGSKHQGEYLSYWQPGSTIEAKVYCVQLSGAVDGWIRESELTL